MAQALAQARCDSTLRLTQFLAERHQEVPVSVAVTQEQTLLTVYAAPAGNWTIVISPQPGVSCIVAHGEGWQDARPQPPTGPET